MELLANRIEVLRTEQAHTEHNLDSSKTEKKFYE